MSDKKMKNQKDSTKARINVPPGTNKNPPSLTEASSVIWIDDSIASTKSGASNTNPETRVNLEDITFVCLNLPFQSIAILYGTLRGINNYIQTFTDSSLCLEWIQSSSDSIFFISSSSDRDLIATIHSFTAIEAIFILNSEAQMSKNDFPKLAGVFHQQEELFMVLDDTLTWFEQAKLELFAFEDEKIFLWSQLWKEERISTKVTSGKGELVDMYRNYYRGNTKVVKLVDALHQSYRPSDAVRWCIRSPFPSRSLNHALRSHNSEQLALYSFLLNDASRVLKQQPKRHSTTQLYKGMKLSSDLVDNLERHAGQLVCASGFFICTKSRTAAMTLASSASRRPDLLSVLFKIDCDQSIPFAELSAVDKTSGKVVVDIYTAFRVMCVNRGQMSVVKMKTASEEGKQIAKEYKKKHREENIQNLLDELLVPPKPPTPPSPPPQKPPTPPPPPPQKLPTPPPPNPPTPSLLQPAPTAKTTLVEHSSMTVSSDEIQAQEHIALGQIDLALAAYRRIQPVSPRILNLIGHIYAEKQNDNEHALECHTQALKIQEEKGEDVFDTLNSLGIVHHSCHEYDLALSCHTRALTLRETVHPLNQLLIASSLRGIANAQWGRHELTLALEAAKRALTIYQSSMPINEMNVATSMAIMANIYHDSKDDVQALELCTQALALMEHSEPPNSSKLGALLHNLGAFQLGVRKLPEARHSFERALKILADSIPPGHPKLIAIEGHIQRIAQMQKEQ